MDVKLVWITPEADKTIAYLARVSNPKATPDDPADKLIAYLIKHKHWSPFEMANACVEIETTRDISRQIIRHRSLHFQELSQRYTEAPEDPEFSDARLQDHKNRQNSIPTDDKVVNSGWSALQSTVWNCCWVSYQGALKLGVAKELARKLLPEGLTKTRMYANGTIRDWLHYISVRTDPTTQLEHRLVAQRILQALEEQCPSIINAARQAGVIAHA